MYISVFYPKISNILRNVKRDDKWILLKNETNEKKKKSNNSTNVFIIYKNM